MQTAPNLYVTGSQIYSVELRFSAPCLFRSHFSPFSSIFRLSTASLFPIFYLSSLLFVCNLPSLSSSFLWIVFLSADKIFEAKMFHARASFRFEESDSIIIFFSVLSSYRMLGFNKNSIRNEAFQIAWLDPTIAYLRCECMRAANVNSITNEISPAWQMKKKGDFQ